MGSVSGVRPCFLFSNPCSPGSWSRVSGLWGQALFFVFEPVSPGSWSLQPFPIFSLWGQALFFVFEPVRRGLGRCSLSPFDRDPEEGAAPTHFHCSACRPRLARHNYVDAVCFTSEARVTHSARTLVKTVSRISTSDESQTIRHWLGFEARPTRLPAGGCRLRFSRVRVFPGSLLWVAVKRSKRQPVMGGSCSILRPSSLGAWRALIVCRSTESPDRLTATQRKLPSVTLR